MSIFLSVNDLGKASKVFFWNFVPNIGLHPPTAYVWDSTEWKVKIKLTLIFWAVQSILFFEKMRIFRTKIPRICLGLWNPTHPQPPLFWDKVLKRTVKRWKWLNVCFHQKVWDFGPPPTHSLGQSPKKNGFFDTFPYSFVRDFNVKCYL